MRLILGSIVLVAATATVSFAKTRKSRRPPPIDVRAQDQRNKFMPPPGYKGTNEGAQGRKNATEDAARSAEGASPDFRRF